jgi:hypothetical protein
VEQVLPRAVEEVVFAAVGVERWQRNREKGIGG